MKSLLYMRLRRSAAVRAFTLAELLVVMAIIGILATVTLMAVSRVSDDARISSAINTLTAGFDNARAIAIKRNRYVMAVLVARWEPPEEQFTELVLAEWTGDTDIQNDGFQRTKDRLVPVQDVQPRRLPAGIKVAGAWYDLANNDDVWVTQPELSRTDPDGATPEVAGRMFGLIFAPDGSIVTFIPPSGADDSYVDFDGDGRQKDPQTTDGSRWWRYDQAEDEPNVEPVPFFAVYDDRLAREIRTSDWTSQFSYENELTGPTGFISNNSDRLYFNRYSGVLMR